MTNEKYILFGGDLGSYSEICENAKSLGEFLLNRFQIGGDKVILVDYVTGQKLTCAQLRSKSIRLAERMSELFDIKAGDVVGICSENRLEFAISLFATILLGATVAPFNVLYTEYELNHALNLSKPQVIFTSLDNFEKLQALHQQNAFIRKLIVYDDIEANVSKLLRIDGVTTFRKVIDFNDTLPYVSNFRCAPQPMKENVSFIFCSSGTTGLPKGVEITQYNMLVANVQHIKRPHDGGNDFPGDRIVMGILPWFHAYGMMVLMVMAMNTTKIVFLPKFNEEQFLRGIETYKANTVYMPPPVLVLLSKSKLVENYDVSSLKVIWCGAAPVSKEIEDDVKRRLNIRAMRQGYGMTEGTFAFCGQNDEKHTHGSVGPLRLGLYGRIVHTETGEILGPHARGELQFKGDCVMKGYVGNVAATKDTIDSDGWLHSGDIGYYDDNGEWYIVDRLKELIKYKAFQVPPAEIESLLLTNEKIKDAGVIGVPDESAGECAMAFVVKQPNVELTEKEVIDFVAKHVSHPKRLHGGVRFVAEIPKNPSGKILRRQLRDLIQKKKSKL